MPRPPKIITQEYLIKEFKNHKFPSQIAFKGGDDHDLAPQNAFLRHAGFTSMDIYKAGIVALSQMMNGRHKRNFSKNGVKAMLSKRKDSNGFKLVLYTKQNKIPKSPFYVRRIDKNSTFINQYNVVGYRGYDKDSDITLTMSLSEIHPSVRYLFLGK